MTAHVALSSTPQVAGGIEEETLASRSRGAWTVWAVWSLDNTSRPWCFRARCTGQEAF